MSTTLATIGVFLESNAQQFLAGIERAATGAERLEGVASRLRGKTQALNAAQTAAGGSAKAAAAGAHTFAGGIKNTVLWGSKLFLIYQGLRSLPQIIAALKPLTKVFDDIRTKGLTMGTGLAAASAVGRAAIQILQTPVGACVVRMTALKMVVDRVSRAFKSFTGPAKGAQKVTESASAAAVTAGRSFAGAVVNIHPMLGLLTSLGAVGATSLALREIAKATGELNSQVLRAHATLGISPQAFGAISTAAGTAGVSMESVVGGMTALERAIGSGIADATGETAYAFRDLGLSAAELQAMSPEQRLNAVADAMAKLEPSAARTAAAEKILGGSSAELFALLDKGSGAFAKGAADADAFGTSLTSVQSDQITNASIACNQLGQVVQGLAVQIGANLAPYVEFAANKVVEFAKSFNLAENAGQMAATVLIEGARFAGDAWDALALVSSLVANGMRLIGGMILNAVQPPLKWVLWALDKVSGTNFSETVGRSIDEMRQSLGKAFEESEKYQQGLLSRPKTTGTEWADALANVRAKATEAAAATGKLTASVEKLNVAQRNMNQGQIDSKLQEIADAVSNFDASKAEQAASALAKLGATQAEQDEARRGTQALADLEAAKKLTEDLQTPAEKYQQQLTELNGLLERGAIDQATYASAALKQYSDLQSALNVDPTRRASIAESGSAEALKAIRDNKARGEKTDWQVKLQELQKQNNAGQQQQIKLLGQIAAGKGVALEVLGL